MGELFAKSSPIPLQKTLHKNHLNKVVSARIDSRREVKPRFGYRERLGTTNPTRSESC